MATATSPAPRVVIGGDEVLVREGISRILSEAGLCIVAQAVDSEQLVGKTLAYRPDVAVVDVQTPRREADGLRAAIEIRRRLPHIGVLVLSQVCEPEFALALIGDRPEGVGYLLKERVADVATFADAVTRVAAGGSALDVHVIGRILTRRATDDALRVLTGRERAVLAAMAEGKSNLASPAAC